MIAGGGTGGHLFPGIAVAREMLAREPDAVVSFAGHRRASRRASCRARGSRWTSSQLGTEGQVPPRQARGSPLPLSGVDAWASSSRRPHVVIGVGGYSSGPVVSRRRSADSHDPSGAERRPWPDEPAARAAVRAAAVTFDVRCRFSGQRGLSVATPASVFGVPVNPTTSRQRRRRCCLWRLSGGARDQRGELRQRRRSSGNRATPHVAHQTGERDWIWSERPNRARTAAQVEPFLYDMARGSGQRSWLSASGRDEALAEMYGGEPRRGC